MSHIEPFRTDRREIPWRAVAVRDESILDLPPNHPLPNGHLWDSMGIYGRQQTHTICGSLVSKVLLMVRGLVGLGKTPSVAVPTCFLDSPANWGGPAPFSGALTAPFRRRNFPSGDGGSIPGVRRCGGFTGDKAESNAVLAALKPNVAVALAQEGAATFSPTTSRRWMSATCKDQRSARIEGQPRAPPGDSQILSLRCEQETPRSPALYPRASLPGAYARNDRRQQAPKG